MEERKFRTKNWPGQLAGKNPDLGGGLGSFPFLLQTWLIRHILFLMVSLKVKSSPLAQSCWLKVRWAALKSQKAVSAVLCHFRLYEWNKEEFKTEMTFLLWLSLFPMDTPKPSVWTTLVGSALNFSTCAPKHLREVSKEASLPTQCCSKCLWYYTMRYQWREVCCCCCCNSWLWNLHPLSLLGVQIHYIVLNTKV